MYQDAAPISKDPISACSHHRLVSKQFADQHQLRLTKPQTKALSERKNRACPEFVYKFRTPQPRI